MIYQEEETVPAVIDLARIPNLESVFQALLRGQHISNEDFNLYHELQDSEAVYETLLSALGYRLISDRRGFYYLVPDDRELTMNATTQKLSLLVFVLVDLLADLGRDPVSSITQGAIDLSEVSGLMVERYGDLLEDGGFTDAESVARYFAGPFRRLGFASVNGDSLRFRPPIHRFLDVCEEVGTGKQAAPFKRSAIEELVAEDEPVEDE